VTMKRRDLFRIISGTIAGAIVPIKSRIDKPDWTNIRIYPSILARDLIGVQPLDFPTGSVFYTKLIYDEDSIK